MPVFYDGTNVIHSDGSRIVWATNRRPANLLPSAAVVLTNFDIAFPDFAKSNAYGFDIGEDFFGTVKTTCASYTSIDPQSWDSGQTLVCTVPASSNYFEVRINMSRVFTPSTYMGVSIPMEIAENVDVLLDGGSVILERIGPLVRIARFEKVGNSIYLRRKQSVYNAGNVVPWVPGNAVYTGSGGKQEGWTYGGSPNAWPSYLIQANGPGGTIHKERGTGACSLVDPTNYASTWRGTVTITPGYIKP